MHSWALMIQRIFGRDCSCKTPQFTVGLHPLWFWPLVTLAMLASHSSCSRGDSANSTSRQFTDVKVLSVKAKQFWHHIKSHTELNSAKKALTPFSFRYGLNYDWWDRHRRIEGGPSLQWHSFKTCDLEIQLMEKYRKDILMVKTAYHVGGREGGGRAWKLFFLQRGAWLRKFGKPLL